MACQTHKCHSILWYFSDIGQCFWPAQRSYDFYDIFKVLNESVSAPMGLTKLKFWMNMQFYYTNMYRNYTIFSNFSIQNHRKARRFLEKLSKIGNIWRLFLLMVRKICRFQHLMWKTLKKIHVFCRKNQFCLFNVNLENFRKNLLTSRLKK